MKKFILEHAISPTDIDFKEAIGKEKWLEKRNELIIKFEYQCQGCGIYMPKNNKHLRLHVINGSIDDLENVEYTILCPACHLVQHIDLAEEKGLIKLVNSIYSQAELIRLGRSKVVANEISKEKRIIMLEKTPKEYIEELKQSVLNRKNKIKIILSKNFDWSTSTDC
jgi:hypothetical protein